MNEPEAHVNSPLQLRAEQDATFAEEMWRFRHPEEGGEKLTLESILVEVPLRYGITVGSLDTLSRFYRWLGLRRRFQDKSNAIRQIQEEMSKDPSISEEQITKVGRRLFLTESVVDKDGKLFADMIRLGQTDTSLAQRDKQLKQRDAELRQREALVAQSERRVALLEAKAAFADEVKKAAANSTGGITAEQMEEIERKLKML